jgi:hypothetical protein
MARFDNAREAKEFLISRIAEQAQRDGVPLSEIERKELYFSETGWTLPDTTSVNEAFERDYDQDSYERKIKTLVREARRRARKETPEEVESWSDAIRILRKEDHYLSVMVGHTSAPRHPIIEWLKPVPIGLGICMFAVLAFAFLQRHFPILQTREGTAFVGWWLAAGAVAIYLIVRAFAWLRRKRLCHGRK